MIFIFRFISCIFCVLFLCGFLRGSTAVTGKMQLGVEAIAVGGVVKNFALGMGINASLLTASPNWPSLLDANNFPNNGVPSLDLGSSAPLPSTLTTSTPIVNSWLGTGASYLNTGSPGITVLSASAGTTSPDCGSLASLPKVCSFGGTFVGTNVRVTYTFNAIPSSLLTNMNFPAGKTYSGMSRFIWAKLSDEAAILAQTDPGDIWSDDFINWIKQANPKVIRTLGIFNVNGGGNVTRWDLRPNWKDTANYAVKYVPGLWGGLLVKGGSDDYSVAAPSGWTGLFDGAVIQGYVTTTNTTRFPTLDVGGSGAKRIIDMYALWPTITIGGTVVVSDTLSIVFNASNLPGGTLTLNYTTTGSTVASAASGLSAAINANSTLTTAGFYASYDVGASDTFSIIYPSSAGAATFSTSASGAETLTITGTIDPSRITINRPNTYIFDSILDAWIWTANVNSTRGGISYQFPVETIVSLANRVNKHLWFNIPCHANDDYIIGLTNYVAANLNLNLLFYAEYCNEVWNFAGAFDQTFWATARGQRLGFPSGNAETLHGWYGLRTKQIFDIMYPILGTRMKRAFMLQAAGNASETQTYRLNGGDLRNSRLSAGGQNYYQQLVGVDYNTFPNRPVDSADSIGYADYMSGAQITNQFSLVTNPVNVGGPNTYTSVVDGSIIQNPTFGGWTEAADNFSSGDPQRIWQSLQFMDWDVRQGIKISNSVSSISSSGCAVVTASAVHSLSANFIIALNTTGAFDAAITKGKNYFVISSGLTSTQFQFSATQGGSCVSVSGASSGTMTWGTIRGERLTSITTYSSLYYSKWQTVAASYNGARPVGMGNVDVELYEGSYEAWYPTAANCVSLGISSGYCDITGSVAQMLTAYKMSVLFYQFEQDRITNCMAQANTKTCAWFQSSGPNQWALLTGDYSGYMNATGASNAFSALYAIQQFNAN